MDSQIKEQSEVKQMKTWVVVLLLIIFLIWILAGFSAFIMSLVCFGKSGTTAKKVVGLLLAFLMGPFYWIYYLVAADYCK
jgi:small neutral amino acid transporter SnatA (MarC family)